MENYNIKKGYTSRGEERFLSQKLEVAKDQNMTYKYAKKVALEKGYKNILDIGCGSGFLLLKYFKEYNTIGYDLPGNVEWLKTKYPDRKWTCTPLSPDEIPDLIICADVIEHVLEPNSFIAFIKDQGAKEIIFSTPQRDALNPAKHPVNGPPLNKYHIREWNYKEFNAYMSRFFTIINHWEKGIHQVAHVKI
jgi:2-polyprenyl-3-methyl-5-hydroxy-6-metoxy-1,4-benzoquinol methylase